MIAGTVTADREIVIRLDIVSTDQSPIPLDAVIDTGFNGFLTLPLEVLTTVATSPAGTRRAELGDGRLVELDVYLVRIRWLDTETEVLALHADATPLVGMSLLWGCRVVFDTQTDGKVTIEALL